jgi:hypothetical protein
VPLIMHDDEKRRAFESRGEGSINEMGMASVEVAHENSTATFTAYDCTELSF